MRPEYTFKRVRILRSAQNDRQVSFQSSRASEGAILQYLDVGNTDAQFEGSCFDRKLEQEAALQDLALLLGQRLQDSLHAVSRRAICFKRDLLVRDIPTDLH